MSKKGNKKIETVETVVESKPLTMAEKNALLQTMQADELKKLELLAATPANELAGTKGMYKTADGKGVTSDKALAKRSTISGKLIPAYTPERPAVNGISATHLQETEQLRGRYRNGWGVAVVARCKAAMEKRKRQLTASEIDRLLSESDVPKAWQPNGEKQRNRPQYQRHLAVLAEFGIVASN